MKEALIALARDARDSFRDLLPIAAVVSIFQIFVFQQPASSLASLLLGSLLVVAGLGLLLWLGVLVRIKWAQHQLRKQGFDPSADLGPSPGTRPVNDDSLEAEYTVISKERED